MKRNWFCGLGLVALVLLCAQCNPNKPVIHPERANTFDKGRAVFYGAYYAQEGIAQNVLSIDLYSENLGLDSANVMVGTGVNLYLSDVFLAPQDTFLVKGTYACDTTAQPLTFLPGMNYEGHVSGAYLLDVTDGNLEKITLLQEGSFTLTYSRDTTKIAFLFKGVDGKDYAAQFSGLLPLYDGRR